jgi:hypothetical protein
MEERKKHPVMVRLSDEDRNWIREQARSLEDLTGNYSESAVIRLVIRRLREGISEGAIHWDLGTAHKPEKGSTKKEKRKKRPSPVV